MTIEEVVGAVRAYTDTGAVLYPAGLPGEDQADAHPMPRAPWGLVLDVLELLHHLRERAAGVSISRYGTDMAARKVTITLDEELAAAASSAASAAGIPLSRLLASAAERELRRRAGLAAVAAWEADNGAFTPAEIAAVRAEMAAADDEYLRGGEKSA